MHMLYNSDSFTVVLFEIPTADAGAGTGEATSRGAFEIVDKVAQKDIFIDGSMADQFQADEPSEEELDEYIGRFASLMPQPLVLH